MPSVEVLLQTVHRQPTGPDTFALVLVSVRIPLEEGAGESLHLGFIAFGLLVFWGLISFILRAVALIAVGGTFTLLFTLLA